ncbi:hypothetical protein OFM21_34050, partial [Escherichia coli]|nr:hypothetical protein [Escherichia coli]
ERMAYDPDRRIFDLRYRPRGAAPTEVVLPAYTYPGARVCVKAAGGTARVARRRLVVRARRGAARVTVRVRPGRCGAHA